MGCDDRRSASIAFFKDFQEIVTRAGVERLKAEVVEDQEIGAAEGFQKARMAAVSVGERELFAELGPAMIDDGAIVPAGLLADGASEPALADAGRTDEGEIVGVEPSVGSVGDSYDNALVETINGLYKAEVIWRRGPWRNFEAVEFATLEWVDWFNNRRLLEPIGNIPPAEAEARYYALIEEPALAA